MIGPLLLFLSWLLLRAQGKGLDALGFNQPVVRLRQFTAGFALTACAASLQQIGYAHAAGTSWVLNPAYSVELLLDSLRWNVNSVLFEELLFRGYLMFQAIHAIGERRAIVLDAVAFGVYHWFTYGVIGNPVAMVYVLISTGLFGLMFAVAFARTGSLALPVGLHLGWNLASNVLFSAGPLGAVVLVAADGARRLGAQGGLGALCKFALPIAIVALVCWRLGRPRPVDVQLSR